MPPHRYSHYTPSTSSASTALNSLWGRPISHVGLNTGFCRPISPVGLNTGSGYAYFAALNTAPLVRYFARWAQYAHVGPHPRPVGHPLSINGEGEWTSACGRCDKFGEGEWTSACGRCDKFGEGEGINPVRGFRIPFGDGE